MLRRSDSCHHSRWHMRLELATVRSTATAHANIDLLIVRVEQTVEENQEKLVGEPVESSGKRAVGCGATGSGQRVVDSGQ